MRSLIQVILLTSLLVWAWPLAAQQARSCADYSIVIGSPEDKLMLAVNGTEDPNAKLAALEKFSQQHPTSPYLPCAEQQLTKTYVALKQYDKAIAAGQKAVAANYLDVPFLVNLVQAYLGAGQASDAAFRLIAMAAPQIKAETVLIRNVKETDAEFQEAQKNAEQQAKDNTAYMSYAFFRLLDRVTSPQGQVKVLDEFTQAYPEVAKQQAGPLNYRYAIAYTQSNQPEKADVYAEKAIAAEPNNVEALNLVAYDYAFRKRTDLDKATEYARRVLTLIPKAKKPEGISQEQFEKQREVQEGMAHLTLGYVDLVKSGRSHRVRGALVEFQRAADHLKASPELQGEAYYFLGYAYEDIYPPQHHHALAALERAASIRSTMQGRARELLAKVRSAIR